MTDTHDNGPNGMLQGVLDKIFKGPFDAANVTHGKGQFMIELRLQFNSSFPG
jgi:hypothetical protein